MDFITKHFSISGNNSLLKSKSIYILASEYCSSYTYTLLNSFIPYLCAVGKTLVIRSSDCISPQVIEHVNSNGGSCLIIYDTHSVNIRDNEIDALLKKDACCLLMSKNIDISERHIGELVAYVSTSLLLTESVSEYEFASITNSFLDLHKDIYVIPGSVYAITSRGTNYLIRSGATLVSDPSHINFDSY